MTQVTGQEARARVMEAAVMEQPGLNKALAVKVDFSTLPYQCQTDIAVFHGITTETKMGAKDCPSIVTRLKLDHNVEQLWTKFGAISGGSKLAGAKINSTHKLEKVTGRTCVCNNANDGAFVKPITGLKG